MKSLPIVLKGPEYEAVELSARRLSIAAGSECLFYASPVILGVMKFLFA
jgi:hypothetical protein